MLKGLSFAKDTVQRRFTGEIRSFSSENCNNLRWSHITKSLGVSGLGELLFLFAGQAMRNVT
jgi:hypothetical protein